MIQHHFFFKTLGFLHWAAFAPLPKIIWACVTIYFWILHCVPFCPLPISYWLHYYGYISQFSSVAQSCPTLCDPMDHSTPVLPSISNSQSLLKLMSIELVMPSNHLIFCCPLILLPSIFPSIRVFSNESALCIRWPKYWRFSFNVSPSSEHPGLISFRMDWLDLLAVQGMLKSLLQHHSSKVINSLVLIFLYSPTLTSIRDYWKNHSLD